MGEALQIVNTKEMPETARREIDTQIDGIILAHRNNRYEINKLVFESVSALAVSENCSEELASQSALKRFWGGITGKNRDLERRIDKSLAASQYAAQQTLQKLAEQNLMSFELITSVNNKLNSSIVQIESEINNVYGVLAAFFKRTKSDIIQLESRVERLEKNVSLLNWRNSIEYLMWDGTEYASLDDVSKIICLTRDFYDITGANWTMSDLLLLKAAMSETGISPKEEISYKKFIETVSGNGRLMEKLFGGMDIGGIECYPEYIAVSAGIKKLALLDGDEKYLVDNAVEMMRRRQCEAEESEVRGELLEIYARDGARMNLDASISAYDLILELLYNLEQIKEIQHMKKLKEAEMLFSEYDTRRLLPLLEELIEYGYTEAKYMMALLYKSGCDGLRTDVDKCWELIEQCAEEGYLPAKVEELLEEEEDDDTIAEEFPDLLGDLEVLAENGDSFASYACYLIYNWAAWNEECIEHSFSGIVEDSDAAYKKAIEHLENAPQILRYYNLGNGVEENDEEAFRLLLKAADCGYGYAEKSVGFAYEVGLYGLDIDMNKAAEYYVRAAAKGTTEKWKLAEIL